MSHEISSIPMDRQESEQTTVDCQHICSQASSPVTSVMEVVSICDIGNSSKKKIRLSPENLKPIKAILGGDSEREACRENLIESNFEIYENNEIPFNNEVLVKPRIEEDTMDYHLPKVKIQPSANEDMEKYFSQIAIACIADKLDLIEPFTCTFCSISFHDFDQLLSHFQLQHNKKRQLPCNICSTNMSYSCSSLQDHLEKTHGMSWEIYAQKFVSKTKTQKVKRCESCNKDFFTSGMYHFHRSYHHKTEHMPCGKCNSVLKSKMALQMHIRKVHNIKWADYKSTNKENNHE